MAPTGIIALLLALGPLGAHSGVLRPEAGFFPFFLAIFLAFASGIALAAAAAYASSTGRAWRRRALAGAAGPLLVAGLVFGLLTLSPASRINDVSTDLEDRPSFGAAAAGALRYPEPDSLVLEAFAELQRTYYPAVQSLESALPPAASHTLALEVAGDLGWRIEAHDPQAGRIEALARTRVFRFEDDVVIRIRPAEAGSRVDLRSRSRFGQGDFGANAARIEAFARAFRAASR